MKKLYITNQLFNNEGFAKMLNTRYKNGAYAVENGVVFDTSIFDVPSYERTMWLSQNIKFMKSEFHTR